MSHVHVLPVDDLRPHEERGADCWCEPSIVDCGQEYDEAGLPTGRPARVIVHHSADGRERHEGAN